jgi:hypothetical protein
LKQKPAENKFGTFSEKEKEELKNSIGNLISRIDFHLSAEKQT